VNLFCTGGDSRPQKFVKTSAHTKFGLGCSGFIAATKANANQTFISGRYIPRPLYRLNILLVEDLVDPFIRQVNAARFTAGHERQFDPTPRLLHALDRFRIINDAHHGTFRQMRVALRNNNSPID
jgi:hypothetical protein